MNRWHSRYGEAFVSLPSVVEQSGLKYEELTIE